MPDMTANIGGSRFPVSMTKVDGGHQFVIGAKVMPLGVIYYDSKSKSINTCISAAPIREIGVLTKLCWNIVILYEESEPNDFEVIADRLKWLLKRGISC